MLFSISLRLWKFTSQCWGSGSEPLKGTLSGALCISKAFGWACYHLEWTLSSSMWCKQRSGASCDAIPPVAAVFIPNIKQLNINPEWIIQHDPDQVRYTSRHGVQSTCMEEWEAGPARRPQGPSGHSHHAEPLVSLNDAWPISQVLYILQNIMTFGILTGFISLYPTGNESNSESRLF